MRAGGVGTEVALSEMVSLAGDLYVQLLVPDTSVHMDVTVGPRVEF